VASQSAVDASALTRLGSLGLVRPSANALQVVVGTVADQLAGEIRDAQRAVSGGAVGSLALTIGNSLPDRVALLAALGGRGNVLTVLAAAGRVRIGVADAAQVDRGALLGLGLRGVAIMPGDACVHLLTGTAASASVADSLANPA
jgi:PTS system N-acetylglucosamine-specific IIC component